MLCPSWLCCCWFGGRVGPDAREKVAFALSTRYAAAQERGRRRGGGGRRVRHRHHRPRPGCADIPLSDPPTCRASLRALAGNPFSRGPGTPARSPGPAAGSHPAAGRGWSWPDPDTFAFPPSETPTRLFDGHSFAGWSGKIGRYWTIENGAIKAIMSPYDAPPVSTYLFSGACRALAFLSRHHHSHTHTMVSDTARAGLLK